MLSPTFHKKNNMPNFRILKQALFYKNGELLSRSKNTIKKSDLIENNYLPPLFPAEPPIIDRHKGGYEMSWAICHVQNVGCELSCVKIMFCEKAELNKTKSSIDLRIGSKAKV